MWKKENNSGRKRRGAEIYFVLYLSALILLLPGKQEKKQNNALEAITSLFQQSFSLLPEKNTLLCKMTTDSTGLPIFQMDTSNILLITGNVQDVVLECIVEDQDVGEVVQVQSTPGSNFSIKYDSIKQLVFFSWHPPSSILTALSESKSYAVTVKAKAKPLVTGNNPELQQLIKSAEPTLMTEAKFNISILTEKNGNQPAKIVYTPAEQNLERLINTLQARTQFQIPESIKSILDFNTGNSIIDPNSNVMVIPMDKEALTLSPALPKIGSPALQNWSNRIIVQGIFSTENYEGKPKVLIEQQSDIPGTASVEEIKSGELIISGIDPGNAPMKVKVIVQRRSDKKTVMTDFEVFPTVFRVPEFPSEIRIGESILIKPNINSMPGMDATAAITDENGQVLKQSLGGAPFTFDLANDRNSKFIYLERRIDGKLFGDRYRIEVKKDAPRIPFDPKVTKNYTDITVRTCGTFEGRPNRSKCKISDASNMKVQELYSSYSKAKDSDCYFQTFRFEKKDPDKPYSGSAQFIDIFGMETDPVPIGE